MSYEPPKQTPTELPDAKPEVPPATQPGSEQPDAEPVGLPGDQAGSEPPGVDAKADQDLEVEEEKKEEQGEEEEGEGECGFCLYMKGGGCREAFINWEKCVEEAEKNNENIVDKCVQVTSMLKQCMDAHSDYYEPILRAEKAAEKQAIEEFEKEARSQQEENKEARVSNSEQEVSKEVRASDSNQA